LPIKGRFRDLCQKLNMITISQDGAFIVGAGRDRIVKIWMDFHMYMKFEAGFEKLNKEKE